MRTPLVLVIEDVLMIRDLFAGVFRSAGFDVEEAEDGAAGMRRVRARVPDVVVCDLEMPHMDGVTFCRCVRADPRHQALPIVIVSGADAVMAGAAFAAGCDALVAKPCSGAVLVATVRRLLETAASTPRAESVTKADWHRFSAPLDRQM
jgi:two-component system chemotaxis response regulator CheY